MEEVGESCSRREVMKVVGSTGGDGLNAGGELVVMGVRPAAAMECCREQPAGAWATQPALSPMQLTRSRENDD